ncbi:MAG: hypothetical protein IJ864_06235 [Alphaproteobacteria bacterium]|nr:hypothetical protein [Alphaproteobacteria bacterium]
MIRKIFLSPFFALTVFLILGLGFIGVVFFQYHQDILRLTIDGEIIDVVAKLGYILLLFVLAYVYRDFEDKMLAWGIYIFLTMCCFLRESGIQHHLSTTDSTPFKSRFFLDPDNPWFEKVIFGSILLLIVGGLGYLAVKFSKKLVLQFFAMDTITWSTAVLCTAGVCSKIIDRFPSNYRKAHEGVALPENVYTILQLVEETSEMFLPYLAILILFQHHVIKAQQ